MPVAWAGQTPMGEYNNLCTNVNLYDASIQRQVEISGPDAFKLAQKISSRDLKKQKIGQCVYAIITDVEGTVINDPLVLKLAEDRYWFSIADRQATAPLIMILDYRGASNYYHYLTTDVPLQGSCVVCEGLRRRLKHGRHCG